jgi:hypothetical protein
MIIDANTATSSGKMPDVIRAAAELIQTPRYSKEYR